LAVFLSTFLNCTDELKEASPVCPSPHPLQLREYYRLKGQVTVRAAKISQELQGLQREQNREKDSVEGMEMRKKEVTMREHELVARK